jgi:hypothetical protein
MPLLSVIPQQDDQGGLWATMMSLFVSCCSLIFAILMIAALWKIFSKAGEPGWAAIIPIYNMYINLKIVDRPWWWLLLMLIPFVNFVIGLIVIFDTAKAFGKSMLFGLGMLILPFIFYLILGFGDAKYQGPMHI